MHPLAPILNSSFSGLSVVAQVLSILLIGALIFPILRKIELVRHLSSRAMMVSLVVATLATLGSLAYSDIVGYEPCKLCWIQRIFMYPLVPLLSIAIWRKDMNMRVYTLVLASLGAIVALYHYLTQLGWNPLNLECAAVGYSVSCAQTFVLQFGYITLPLMAFSAFLFIAVTTGLSLRSK